MQKDQKLVMQMTAASFGPSSAQYRRYVAILGLVH